MHTQRARSPRQGRSRAGRTKRALAGSAVIAAVTSITATAATGAAATGPDAAGTTPPAGTAEPRKVHSFGRFYPPGMATNAFTYDRSKVTVGASITVDARHLKLPTSRNGKWSMVALQVRGLLPHRAYGAHVHYLPCGPTGAAAGAHYQHVRDPAVGESRTTMSTDPRYARPGNEVWLDLTTDSWGNGWAISLQGWHFRPGEARSMVIHEHRTSHGGHGHPPAGDAGPRLGCLTVPF